MVFDSAFISLLSTDGEPALTIHSVLEIDNEQQAQIMLVDTAKSYLRNLYNDKFAGCVNSHDELLTNPVGSYVLLSQDAQSKITVWLVSEVTVSGWMSSSVEKSLSNIGYFAYTKITGQVLPNMTENIRKSAQLYSTLHDKKCALEKQVESLTSEVKFTKDGFEVLLSKLKTDISVINAEKKVIADQLTAANNTIDLLKIDYDCIRRAEADLVEERVYMLEENAKHISHICELCERISMLKSEITEKEYEIIGLKEEVKYNRIIPSKKVSTQNCEVYSEAVEQIKNFDMNKLLTRDERDQLLAAKGHVDVEPVVKQENVPPPWAKLRSFRRNICP